MINYQTTYKAYFGAKRQESGACYVFRFVTFLNCYEVFMYLRMERMAKRSSREKFLPRETLILLLIISYDSLWLKKQKHFCEMSVSILYNLLQRGNDFQR